MKKLILISFFGLALGSQMLYAGESGGGMQSFWERLRSKIESLAPQKKVIATNATGGVRGAASVSSEDVYWKGEASVQAIASDELEAFTAAMRLAEANDAAQAQAAFSAFVKNFPGSSLRKDAEQALSLLKP